MLVLKDTVLWDVSEKRNAVQIGGNDEFHVTVKFFLDQNNRVKKKSLEQNLKFKWVRPRGKMYDCSLVESVRLYPSLHVGTTQASSRPPVAGVHWSSSPASGDKLLGT